MSEWFCFFIGLLWGLVIAGLITKPFHPNITDFCGDITRYEPQFTESVTYKKYCKDTSDE